MATKKPKKAAPAKSAKKPKPAAKKPAAKKPVAKKPAPKPVKAAAKPASKPKVVAKPAEKKPAAKAPEVKKPVVEVKKPVAKPVPPPAPLPPPPAAKKGSTSKKIPLPSRVIKKDPIVVTHSPESQELIKKTIEPRLARQAAAAEKKPEVKKIDEKPVITPLEKRGPEKKPMIVKHSAQGGKDEEKKFYSREELEEFRQIINEKMAEAKEEYKRLVESLQETNEMSADGYNMTEFGSDTIDKEQTEMFLARQKKFMNNLERALVRIENGTYGRCKVTGKLIPKERLRLVPHTESSIEAKQQQYDNTNVSTEEF